MLIKDSFMLDAPRDAVWALFEDVERAGSCVPGVEKITRVDDQNYQGLLKVKVGPIAASFNGQVRIVERSAQDKIVAEVTGEDKGSASRVKATFTGRLSPEGEATRLDYEMEVALRGRLGQFGGAVVRATAKKMTAEFARKLNALLSETTAAG
jgi:uncharacterized protein